jgi:hypothetical protein
MTQPDIWKADKYTPESSAAIGLRWHRFVENVCTILRIETIHGRVNEDGYSLEEALQQFNAGKRADEYAGLVRARLLAWGRS